MGLLHVLTEQDGRDIIQSLGGVYIERGPLLARMSDETWQALLAQVISALSSGGGGAQLTVALGLSATGDGLRSQALQLSANLNEVTSGVGEAPGVILPGSLPIGSVVVISVNNTSLDIWPHAGAKIDNNSIDGLVHVGAQTTTTLYKYSSTQWYSAGNQTFLSPPPP